MKEKEFYCKSDTIRQTSIVRHSINGLNKARYNAILTIYRVTDIVSPHG